MKQTKTLLLALPLAFLGLLPPASNAVTITFSLNGFYGSNFVSDGVTPFAAGTKVKLGFFYSGSSFQAVSAVNTTWTGLTGSLSSRLATLGSSFYTIAETSSTLNPDNGAEFQILWHLSQEALDGAVTGATKYNSKFETVISTPGIGSGSFDVKGQNAFVWIENADKTEFGLFASNGLIPTVADEDWALDVNSGLTDTGVIAIAGATNAGGVTLIPEPTSGALLGLGLGLLALARRKIYNQDS